MNPSTLPVQILSTAVANYGVLTRTMLTVAANSTSAVMQMAETASQMTAPATGEPLDVDVPEPVRIDG